MLPSWRPTGTIPTGASPVTPISKSEFRTSREVLNSDLEMGVTGEAPVGMVPVGRQLGSIVQISYRWEDSTIHQADFVTQGGGRVLWHVWHDPFGANGLFSKSKARRTP